MQNPEHPWLPASRLQRALLFALAAASLAEALLMLAGGRVHNNDFKHLWAGSRILAEGYDPYEPEAMFGMAKEHGLGSINPFVYFPATGLMLRPFSALPFPAAAVAWFWINFALAWLCALAGPIWMRLERVSLGQLAGAAFIVGAFPFYRQMAAGQMNVVVLAALVFAAGGLGRKRDLSAGAALGLAAAFKIAPFFLIVLLAGMRRWRAGAAGLAAFAAMMALAVAWSGWEVHFHFLPVLRQMGFGRSTWEAHGMDFYRDPFNQSPNALFHHLFTTDPTARDAPRWFPWANLGPAMANTLTYALALAMLAGLAATLLRYRRRPYFSNEWGEPESALFMIGALLMLLLPSLMWDHYAVQALAPLMWLFGSRRLAARPALAAAALVIFFSLAYPWIHQPSEAAGRAGWGVLAMSIRLWGTLGLLAAVGAEWSRAMGERRV